jgi:hypothetical protein
LQAWLIDAGRSGISSFAADEMAALELVTCMDAGMMFAPHIDAEV